jgi:site-specific DNA recombinase
MKAIGIVRVSTEEQADDGVSVEAQTSKIKAYARLYDIEIVDIVVDAGYSGKNMDRPGLQKALATLKCGEVGGIIVAKLDRLTRNIGDMNTMIVDYFTRGGELMSVDDRVDTATASGRLVLNVLMSVYQWERETIVERTKDALRWKNQNGERTGSVPYGYDLADDGVKLIPNPVEQGVIADIRRMKSEGVSLQKICDRLNVSNIPTKKAGMSRMTKDGILPFKGKWGIIQVVNILKKEAS